MMTNSFSFKFNYIDKHLHLGNNIIHLKLWYTDSNFLTKRALVSRPSTVVVTKDPNVSHFLNLSTYSPIVILPII